MNNASKLTILTVYYDLIALQSAINNQHTHEASEIVSETVSRLVEAFPFLNHETQAQRLSEPPGDIYDS